jgi:hypothetical protein
MALTQWPKKVSFLLNVVQNCYFGTPTLSITTLSITTLSITTLSITTLSITTLCITTLSIKDLYVKLSIGDRIKTLGITTFCHYAECRVLFIIKLNVIMLNVIMLNVSMLSVVILSVVAPLSHPRRVGEGQKEERETNINLEIN